MMMGGLLQRGVCGIDEKHYQRASDHGMYGVCVRILQKIHISGILFFDIVNMQVVAGLKKFVKVEELEGKKVCVILNLKPAKLAGQVSEAMILAGSVMVDGGNEIVKVGSLFFLMLSGQYWGSHS